MNLRRNNDHWTHIWLCRLLRPALFVSPYTPSHSLSLSNRKLFCLGASHLQISVAPFPQNFFFNAFRQIFFSEPGRCNFLCWIIEILTPFGLFIWGTGTTCFFHHVTTVVVTWWNGCSHPSLCFWNLPKKSQFPAVLHVFLYFKASPGKNDTTTNTNKASHCCLQWFLFPKCNFLKRCQCAPRAEALFCR